MSCSRSIRSLLIKGTFEPPVLVVKHRSPKEVWGKHVAMLCMLPRECYPLYSHQQIHIHCSPANRDFRILIDNFFEKLQAGMFRLNISFVRQYAEKHDLDYSLFDKSFFGGKAKT